MIYFRAICLVIKLQTNLMAMNINRQSVLAFVCVHLITENRQIVKYNCK